MFTFILPLKVSSIRIKFDIEKVTMPLLQKKNREKVQSNLCHGFPIIWAKNIYLRSTEVLVIGEKICTSLTMDVDQHPGQPKHFQGPLWAFYGIFCCLATWTSGTLSSYTAFGNMDYFSFMFWTFYLELPSAWCLHDHPESMQVKMLSHPGDLNWFFNLAFGERKNVNIPERNLRTVW